MKINTFEAKDSNELKAWLDRAEKLGLLDEKSKQMVLDGKNCPLTYPERLPDESIFEYVCRVTEAFAQLKEPLKQKP